VGPRSVAQALGCQDHGTDTTARGVDNQVLIRKFQEGRRARVLLRVGEEGRELPQGSGVVRQEGQKSAERFDSLRGSETSGSAPGCRPPAR
jgi:hypothetical protein